jgi:filamentous hemagglutinin
MSVVRRLAATALVSCLALVPMVPAEAAASCTTTFTQASGPFTVAANWSTGAVPGPEDYACIPAGSTATLTGAHTVRGIRIDGTLAGQGSLTVQGTGTADESDLTGLLSDADLRIASGSLVVVDGSMNRSATLTVGAAALATVSRSGARGTAGLRVEGISKIINDGTMQLVGQGVTGDDTLLLNNPASLLQDNGVLDLAEGAGVITGPNDANGITVGPAGVLRSSTPGVVAGVGAIVELEGRAEATLGTLSLLFVSVPSGTTTATMTAAGGSLDLAHIDAEPGSRVTVDGAGGVSGSGGGAAITGGGEVVLAAAPARWDNLDMGSGTTLRVAPAASLEVTNVGPTHAGLTVPDTSRVVNEGTVSFLKSTTSTLPSLNLSGADGALVNSGELFFQDGADGAGPGTLTNAAGGTITKTGATTTQIASTVDNDGTLRSVAGLFELTGPFPAIVGTALTRGGYEVTAPGVLKVPGDVTENRARIVLQGSGARFQDAANPQALRNLTVNSGLLNLRDGASQVVVGALSQQGRVVLGRGTTLQTSSFTQSRGATTLGSDTSALSTSGATTVTGGVLRGTGTVRTGAAGLTAQAGGLLEPGSGGPGTLRASGPLTLGPGGRLAVDVDGTGPGQADRLVVTGAVRLAGGLAIDTGYAATAGDTVEIVTAGAVTGTFGTITGDSAGDALRWQPSYGATGVSLVAAPAG